jgi:hypothetical protein
VVGVISFKEVNKLQKKVKAAFNISFSPDRQMVAAAMEDGLIHIFGVNQ